jgi:hypothetical protein
VLLSRLLPRLLSRLLSKVATRRATQGDRHARRTRAKRIVNGLTGAVTVVNKATNGAAEPYFDRTRKVWVAPWHRPGGKVGRPTGRTRALAEASRDRNVAASNDSTRLSRLAQGFHVDSTMAELMQWWLIRSHVTE